MPSPSEIGSSIMVALALVIFMILAPVVGTLLGFLLGLFISSSLAYNIGSAAWDWVRRRRA